MWVSNLEPFEEGSLGYNQKVSPGVPGDARVSSVSAFGVDSTVLTVRVSPGARLTYRFSIRNTGPLPVEILDAGDHRPGTMVGRRVVRMEPDLWDGPSFDEFEAFRPFTIQPDGEAALEIEVRVAPDAKIACGWWYWYSEPVTFRILGFERVQDSVDTGVEVRVTTDEPC